MRRQMPLPLGIEDCTQIYDVGRGEGDNMAGGSGEVVVGRAGALYAMASILARSHEAVRDRIGDIVASSVASCCRRSLASRQTANSAACAAAS